MAHRPTIPNDLEAHELLGPHLAPNIMVGEGEGHGAILVERGLHLDEHSLAHKSVSGSAERNDPDLVETVAETTNRKTFKNPHSSAGSELHRGRSGWYLIHAGATNESSHDESRSCDGPQGRVASC